MTDTAPNFTMHTEATIDRAGRDAYITVVCMDDVPVFSFFTEPHGGRAAGYDHVVSGVGVRERDDYGFGRDVRYNGTPTSGTIYYTQEPTIDEVIATRLDQIAYARGADFLRGGAKGAPIPTGERDAFYEGLKNASGRCGRRIRSGRLTGEPRNQF